MQCSCRQVLFAIEQATHNKCLAPLRLCAATPTPSEGSAPDRRTLIMSFIENAGKDDVVVTSSADEWERLADADSEDELDDDEGKWHLSARMYSMLVRRLLCHVCGPIHWASFALPWVRTHLLNIPPFLATLAAPGSPHARPTGPHASVLEVCGFSPEMSTAQLKALLGTYQTNVDIRWVDDTHALAVFRNVDTAMAAYADQHKLPLELYLYRDASAASKRKCGMLPPASLCPSALAVVLRAALCLQGARVFRLGSA